MKKSEELQKKIIEVIKKSEINDVEKIKVVVGEDGFVLLSGIVSSYRKKIQISNVAINVTGVIGVKDKIIIQFHKSL